MRGRERAAGIVAWEGASQDRQIPDARREARIAPSKRGEESGGRILPLNAIMRACQRFGQAEGDGGRLVECAGLDSRLERHKSAPKLAAPWRHASHAGISSSSRWMTPSVAQVGLRRSSDSISSEPGICISRASWRSVP